MTVVTALYGHNSFETAYLVESYPYGSLRCKIWFWLENKANKGYRFVSRTENPKNGRLNAPKPSTYAKFGGNMYLDENGHVQWACVTEYTDAHKVLEFVKNFPKTECANELRIWCIAKAAYEKKCIDRKHTGYGEMSPERLEKATLELNDWLEAARLLKPVE